MHTMHTAESYHGYLRFICARAIFILSQVVMTQIQSNRHNKKQGVFYHMLNKIYKNRSRAGPAGHGRGNLLFKTAVLVERHVWSRQPGRQLWLAGVVDKNADLVWRINQELVWRETIANHSPVFRYPTLNQPITCLCASFLVSYGDKIRHADASRPTWGIVSLRQTTDFYRSGVFYGVDADGEPECSLQAACFYSEDHAFFIVKAPG
jgi:hypothetical protein